MEYCSFSLVEIRGWIKYRDECRYLHKFNVLNKYVVEKLNEIGKCHQSLSINHVHSILVSLLLFCRIDLN